MSLISKLFSAVFIFARVLLVLISLLLISGLYLEYAKGELEHMYFFWTCKSWIACFLYTLPLLIFIAPVFVEAGLLMLRLKKRTPVPFSADD
jgi:hypothetical protein